MKAVNRFINSRPGGGGAGDRLGEGLAYCAHGFPAAVGFVFAGVFGGGWVGVFGCWSPPYE